MPFNGSGTFTVVNTFIPNTTILSSAVNANFSDIATGLSDVLTRDGQAGMTAALKAIAGTAAAPSITFSSDASTGIYLISSGNLGITSNGVLAAQIDQFQIMQLQQAAEAKLFCVVDTANASTSSNINTIATAGTGSIAIGTSTSWATNGYLIAGNEVMSYTVASAAALTINARGQMGTTSVSHATGSTITSLLTSVARQTILLPARATASRSSNPAPGEFAYNSGALGLEFYNGSVWVSAAQPQVQPQGYLSPTAGTPIITADAVSQTSIFYNPFKGNVIPIPNDGIFTLQTFATSSIALSASQTTAGIYDIYGFISTTNSTLTFGISPSWAAGSSGSVTPGSCARGTGAGGTALTRTSGLFTNAVAMTILNGANSYSITSNSGLYLGSIYIGATAGTVNLHRGFGQNRQWGIWNAFNSVPLYLKSGEATASWTYATGVLRPSNNSTANSLAAFSGLAENMLDVDFLQQAVYASAVNTLSCIAIGVNSTGTSSGVRGSLPGISSGFGSNPITIGAKYVSTPLFGVNIITSLESASNSTITFSGTEAGMAMSAKWRG